MIKPRAMLDLETLGQSPGSVIVALGAVKFGAEGVGREFYRRIDPQSCVDAGLRMDVSTVMWWLQQSDAAREEIARPGQSLKEVLSAFAGWLDDDTEVWGNGSDFDNAILAAAYGAIGEPPPWKFWNNRCYRTVKNIHPEVPLERRGVAHNAVDDAVTQALHLLEIFDAEKSLR